MCANTVVVYSEVQTGWSASAMYGVKPRTKESHALPQPCKNSRWRVFGSNSVRGGTKPTAAKMTHKDRAPTDSSILLKHIPRHIAHAAAAVEWGPTQREDCTSKDGQTQTCAMIRTTALTPHPMRVPVLAVLLKFIQRPIVARSRQFAASKCLVCQSLVCHCRPASSQASDHRSGKHKVTEGTPKNGGVHVGKITGRGFLPFSPVSPAPPPPIFHVFPPIWQVRFSWHGSC